MSKFNLTDLIKYKTELQKITMLTAYDYSSARLAELSGIDMILVGDSLGMVIQGNANTISVTMDEILYHTKMVKKGAPNTFIVADMPYLSYHINLDKTIANAGRLMQEGMANAVKLEVNSLATLHHVTALINAQIPVIGHIGLTPQSVNVFGGFKVQGKTQEQAQHIVDLAEKLQEAGVSAIVLECIPKALAMQITQSLTIPTIGIGSGAHCDGQVLVFHDLLELGTGHPPKFVKSYLNGGELITKAISSYVNEVREATFPTNAHSYDI